MFFFSRIKLSFSSTFPGKISIFKEKLKIKHFLSTSLKFKHFSRPVTTLVHLFDAKPLHESLMTQCQLSVQTTKVTVMWVRSANLSCLDHRQLGWRPLNPGLPTSKILFPYFVEKISVFWVTFPYPLICSSPDSKLNFLFTLVGSIHSQWKL